MGGYSHTQKAPLCLILYGSALFCLVLAWIVGETPGLFIAVAVGLVIAMLGPAFHHLTVEDQGEVLVIRFGPVPLFRRTVSYAEIEKAEVGRTLILDGWGIHYSIRGGWVWNLWGRDCVVAHSKDGGLLRIGTDDAEGLARFLEGKIPREEATMPEQDRKLSDILKEMAETIMRDPRKVPSSEAAHVALFFANAAWNECVGLDGAREGYRNVWETIEAENPALWNEFTSNDINGMIDELIKYKKAHFPDDHRRILTCGIPDNTVRVEWLPPAAPGVDTKWEMRLYGLVRTGQRTQAIKFLQETRRMSRTEAEKQVKKIVSDLGLR